MRNTAQEKKSLTSYAVIAGLIVLFAIIAVGFSREFYRKQRMARELALLQQQITELEQSNKDLANFLQYLESDAFVEAEAKTKMNLKKPGEKVVVLQLGNSTTENVTPKTAFGTARGGSVAPASHAALWWAYFFNRNN